MTWNNSDNLFVKFGREQGIVHQSGEYRTAGSERVVEVEIENMADLTTTDTIITSGMDGYNLGALIPEGAFIKKVEVFVETACAGANAVLDIGLVKASDRTTELDYDGLAASLAVTSIDAAGDIVELIQGGTSHGALIGTTLSEAGYITASEADGNAFTAGKLRIRVIYEVL